MQSVYPKNSVFEHLALQLPWFTSLFNAFVIAAGGYSIVRAGVRFFNLSVPGQCITNTFLNFNIFATGNCPPANPDWLLTRVSFATSAHAWSWVMYGAFALAAATYPRPFNGVRGFMVCGLAIAFHELVWFGTYFILHPGTIVGNLQVYGSFIAAMGVGVAIFFVAKYQKLFSLKFFILWSLPFLIFETYWALIGFPLTLDLVTGVTQYFNSIFVNGLEFLSWVFVFVAVGGAYASSMHLRERV